MAYLKGGAFGCAGYRSLCFSFWKRFISCAEKAAGHRSAKRSFMLCISLPCGNEGIAGFLEIGKSWNSANRGVRNNHTKPTIKPVCRLGKLAEFLDKSRRNDKKSNETRWIKSTTWVLLRRSSPTTFSINRKRDFHRKHTPLSFAKLLTLGGADTNPRCQREPFPLTRQSKTDWCVHQNAHEIIMSREPKNFEISRFFGTWSRTSVG